MELELNPETVCYFIDKAREFHAKEAVSIPESPDSPADDWAQQVLADHLADPVYQELETAVQDLEPDQQCSLVALMWLGRGDFTLEEWDEAVAEAVDNLTDRTADYLITTPLVADYLQEGLSQFGHDCE